MRLWHEMPAFAGMTEEIANRPYCGGDGRQGVGKDSQRQ